MFVDMCPVSESLASLGRKGLGRSRQVIALPEALVRQPGGTPFRGELGVWAVGMASGGTDI